MAKMLVAKNKWNSDRWVALLRTQRVGWHHGCVCMIQPYLTCDLVRNFGLGCGCKASQGPPVIDYRLHNPVEYQLYKCNL